MRAQLLFLYVIHPVPMIPPSFDGSLRKTEVKRLKQKPAESGDTRQISRSERPETAAVAEHI